MEMPDCAPLALSHSDEQDNDWEREGRRNEGTKIPENKRDSVTSIAKKSMTSCFTEILLSCHMGRCRGTEMRPRWWAGLALPKLATQGRLATQSSSAETVSMVPVSHMDKDWSILSACNPLKCILGFKSLCLNCEPNRKADLRCGVAL